MGISVCLTPDLHCRPYIVNQNLFCTQIHGPLSIKQDSVMLCVSVSSVSVDCVTVTSPYSPSADPEEPGLTSEY